jgi:hypothetical protein
MAIGTKTGGRIKGTPNKNTAELREQFQQLVNDNIDLLNDDIKALEPKDRIKAILDLSKFILPTLKATELTGSTENGITPVVIQFEFGDD